MEGKKGVSFVEPEVIPRLPPRRQGKGRGGLQPEQEVDETEEEEEKKESKEEEEEEDGIGDSRLPQLLRRDTFGDALDFRLYSLKRLPWRRASSLDNLCWEEELAEEEEEEVGNNEEEVTRSTGDLSKNLGERKEENLEESKARWLAALLQKDEKKDEEKEERENKKRSVLCCSERSSLSESLKELETGLIEMLRASSEGPE